MFCCSQMAYNIEEAKSVTYNEVFDEYIISIPEDDISGILLSYCPWCGRKLPPSRREEWFSELEALGFDDPLFDGSIPISYRTCKWRNP